MNDGLSAELRHILGSENVSTESGQLDRFAGDALGVFRAFRAAPRLDAQPVAIAWPTSIEQVSRVLKFANQHVIPVVPYGGGTGVMGAATSSEGCIVLNLQRMNAILNISKEDMTVRLQAGVVLQDAASAMEEVCLVLGHDPWSRPIATVGGAISTNGVGYTAARHGSMGEQVLGLEAVLADGEIIRTRGVPKPSYGPSLNHLFIGSEGTFGVITEATLRAFPVAEKRVLRSMVFPDFESGFKAVTQLYAEGVRPVMVDYGEEMWSEQPSENEDATLFLMFEGFTEDVDAHEQKANRICGEYGGRPGDQEEVQKFWDTRHASGERYLREVLQSQNPGDARRQRSAYRMEYLHVALPVSQVLEYRRRCQEIFTSRQVIVREWSTWARPELFSFLIVEEEDAGNDTSASMAEVVDKVLTLAQDMGGTMEYCHGVGIKLAHLMDREAGAGIAVMKRMKQALDPNNILNPGKQLG